MKRPRQSVGIMGGVYAAHFTHGDRHANARDDTEIQLSLRGSETTAAISREGVGLRCICFIAFSASKQQAGFFGYIHYLPVIALYNEKLPVISAVRHKIHPLVFPDFFHVRFEFFLGEYILAYINV